MFFKKKRNFEHDRPIEKPERKPVHEKAKGQLWEFIGTYAESSFQWRLTALIALTLLFIALAVIFNMTRQSRVVPYVVAVDKINQMVAVKRADVASVTPNSVIQAELANVITNWRSVTTDLGLQNRMISKLSSVLRGAAKGVVTEWFAQNNPVARAKEGHLVSVKIKGVPLPVSENAWRVEWQETLRNLSGVSLENSDYEATLVVRISPPETDAEILRNPGGVYVTELSFGTTLNKNIERLERSRGEVKE